MTYEEKVMTHIGPPNRTGQKLNFQLLKIQDGGRLPSWKSKIGHISGTVPLIFTKVGTLTHIGPPYARSPNHSLMRGVNRVFPEPDRKLKFSTFENPRWRSLTDEQLTEQHWQTVFLFSKPIVIVSDVVEKKHRLVVEVESLASSSRKLRRVDVKA